MKEINEITRKIIGGAIQVHRHLGPGLLESIYEEALCIELHEAGLAFARQVPLPLVYRGFPIGDYRMDLLVEDSVVVEVKSVVRLEPVFEAQVLTYLKISGKRLGLLINFNSALLREGIRRLVH